MTTMPLAMIIDLEGVTWSAGLMILLSGLLIAAVVAFLRLTRIH